jgi:hypothetical protein
MSGIVGGVDYRPPPSAGPAATVVAAGSAEGLGARDAHEHRVEPGERSAADWLVRA